MPKSTTIEAITEKGRPSNADALAIEQIKKFDDLVGKRKERDSDWQIIAQYALPQESTIVRQQTTESVAGWTDLIYDTTMIQAAETLAGGLFNWWTPMNQPWAEYGVPKGLGRMGDSEKDTATKWLGEASDFIMEEFGRSNLYSVKAAGDLGLATFATDLIIVEESEAADELFNFIGVRIGTYVIEENYKGIVDTVRRLVGGDEGMTYRQIKQKFNKPGDTIPEEIEKQAGSSAKGGKKFQILHCIFPREDSERLPGSKLGKDKPIASVYIAKESKKVIRVSGYDESPILCRRFKKWVTQWGYGPAYLALPDARQVNYVQRYLDALAELHINPRFLYPAELYDDIDLRPGGGTPFDPMNPAAKPEEWATTGDYKLGMELQEQKRQAIRDAFYNSAFKLLNSPPLLDKDMTAFEISQRQSEQLENITAVDARQISEFINPLMLRSLGIAYRRGALGRAPKSLLQQTGRNTAGLARPVVVVTSRFNDALRALKNRGAQNTAEFVLNLGKETQQPYLFGDAFDAMKLIKEYGRNAGIAPDVVRADKGPNSTEAIQKQRAAMQAQQRAAQMAETLGKAGKGLGGSPDWLQQQAQEQFEQQKPAA